MSRVEIGIAKWPKNCNEPATWWSQILRGFRSEATICQVSFVFLEEIHWDASVSCGYTKMDDAPLLSNTKDTVKMDGLMIIQFCLVTGLKIVQTFYWSVFWNQLSYSEGFLHQTHGVFDVLKWNLGGKLGQSRMSHRQKRTRCGQETTLAHTSRTTPLQALVTCWMPKCWVEFQVKNLIGYKPFAARISNILLVAKFSGLETLLQETCLQHNLVLQDHRS